MSEEFVSEIEQELIDATRFVPEKKYRDRQKYLGALLRAVCDDLTDEEFDTLSEEAAEWTNNAVEAHKAGEALPDFVNGEDHEASDDEDAEPVEAAEGQDQTDETEEVDSSETEKYEGPNYLPKKKKAGRPKGSTNKAKAAKVPKEPKVKAKAGPKREARGLNKWGVANGTKSDIVCRMLAQEGGTTMHDIVEATGHTRYNVVNRLVRQGHRVVKDGLNLKMTHKNDV